jgi:hypothetical protein
MDDLRQIGTSDGQIRIDLLRLPPEGVFGWRKGPGDEAAHLLLHILIVGLRVKEIAVEKAVAGCGGAGLGGVFGISAGSFER